MTNPSDDDRELLALSAVGALDADEQAALDELLRTRPDLRVELDELRAAAAVLADAEAAPPPPSMRAGVLAAIRDVPQESPAGSTHATEATTGAPVVELRSRRRRWMPALAAAAVAAAAAIAVVAIAPWDGSDELRVAEVVTADDAVTIELIGALSGMRLVHSPDHEAVALVGEQVPAPAGDDVYELWLIDGSRPTPMATFRPPVGGTVEMLMPGLTPPPGAEFAITVEPAGGSDTPTGEVVARSA